MERVLTIVKEQSIGRLGALLGILYNKKSSGIVLEGELLYPWGGGAFSDCGANCASKQAPRRASREQFI